MKVTTTVNGTSRYVVLESPEGASMNLLMQPEETAEAALRREAAGCRFTAARLLKRARSYDAGADTLLLSQETPCNTP